MGMIFKAKCGAALRGILGLVPKALKVPPVSEGRKPRYIAVRAGLLGVSGLLYFLLPGHGFSPLDASSWVLYSGIQGALLVHPKLRQLSLRHPNLARVLAISPTGFHMVLSVLVSGPFAILGIPGYLASAGNALTYLGADGMAHRLVVGEDKKLPTPEP
jgi:hypothetical protein